MLSKSAPEFTSRNAQNDFMGNQSNRWWQKVVPNWHHELASEGATVPYAIAGIVIGLMTGLVMVLFRSLFELPLEYFFSGDPEDFESMPPWLYFVLPASGGLLLGILLQRFGQGHSQTGVAHTVHAVHNLHGRLPWQNALVQLFGGALALGTGMSVGREGPAVHLGSATASLLGQRLGLPNNSLTILVGCGTAAAIAASFNTPIAGIIFAMEVVLMEYTIAGFMPIMLAAVCGTFVTRLVYGDIQVLPHAEGALTSLPELSWVMLVALATATTSMVFVRLIKFWLRNGPSAIWARIALAGVICGLCGLAAPQILGTGYDTLASLVSESWLPITFILVIIAKLIASSACVGLGVPGGMIGPALFIGASVGGLIGYAGTILMPGLAIDSELYVLLGMAAMMAAMLNAPLAALLALVELTWNPAMIFPGLLVITVTNITHRSLFRQPSAVAATLTHFGITVANDPMSLALQRRGVTSLMSSSFQHSPRHLSVEQLDKLQATKPDWILVEEDNKLRAIKGGELNEISAGNTEENVDLLSSSHHRPTITIDNTASLKQAWLDLNKHKVRVLLIRRTSTTNNQGILGVLTRNNIEQNIWKT
ncbi:MAG: chloride channel protein [Pseudomonadales bacterium]